MTYRVYFNRKAEAPQVWSIDEGTQESEVNVQWIKLIDVSAETKYAPTDKPYDSPAAWFEVRAKYMILTEGGAILYGR